MNFFLTMIRGEDQRTDPAKTLGLCLKLIQLSFSDRLSPACWGGDTFQMEALWWFTIQPAFLQLTWLLHMLLKPCQKKHVFIIVRFVERTNTFSRLISKEIIFTLSSSY